MLFLKHTKEKRGERKMEEKKMPKESKEEKSTFKEKLKNFIKNKKAVAMVIEYILTIECFTMLFLLTTPIETRAATFTDESGITWTYTLSNGQATNVYKSAGTLTSTLTIPAYLDGYPVVSIGRNSVGCNILNSTGTNYTIKEIILPETLITIGDYSFNNLQMLTKITIPNSVTSIGRAAFSTCTRLAEIEIPSSVTSIGDYVFDESTGLTKINVSESNLNYSSDDGILYNRDKTSLIKCPLGKKGEVEILNSVTRIANFAFCKCTGLTSIEIPEGITSIGYDAFMGCTGLTSIVIEENISVQAEAFMYCTSLTTIEIKNGYISEKAFLGCTNIKKITMPGTATICNNAFSGVTNVEEVVLTGEGATPNYSPSTVQYTPWYQSRNKIQSITIGDKITSIGNYAFYNSLNNTYIYINNAESKMTFGTNWNSNAQVQYKYYGINKNIDTTLNNLSIRDNSENDLILPNEDYYFYVLDENEEVVTNNKVSVNMNNDRQELYPDDEGKYSILKIQSDLEIIVGNNGISNTARDENNIIWNYTYQNGTAQEVYYESGDLGEVVVIPNELDGLSVKSIGNGVYNLLYNGNYTNIKEIIIPVGIETIQKNAFNGCVELTNIIIGNSVTNIETNAFYDCTGLKKITMPGIVTIVQNAFSGVTNVEEVILTGEGEMATYNSSTYTYTPWYISRNKIKSITIGDKLTSVGQYAFYYCTGLTSIEIPSSVTSIGNYAFSGCTGLTSIEIPSSVTSIGNYAFSGCTGLTEIEIPRSVTNIGNGAFSSCTGLTTIEIPNSITSIGSGAFSGCTGLTEIEIPNSVTSIEYSAFYNCTGITKITMPGTAAIGNNAFNNVTNVEEVILTGEGAMPDYNSTYIYTPWYQSRNNIKSITIGEGITRIGNVAFHGCTGLTSIEIPDGVTSIGNLAFQNCSGLTEIEIPDSVTSIGNYAFSQCTGLTSIEIPDGVTSIGEYAFRECTGLKKITMPGTITITYEMFYNVTNVEEVVLTGEGAMPDYNTSSGSANYYQNTPWYQSRNKIKSITIEEGLIVIGNYAFYNCTGLTEIEIPDSVTSIGNSAFQNCTGLTEIEIPDSVTSIGNYAFSGCTGLTKITMPGTASIGNYAFNNVTNVEEVILTGEGTMPNYNDSTYQYTPWYKSRNNIQSITIGEGITTIGNSAFRECTGLTSMTIPNSVTSIGERSFVSCTGLTSIEIPSSVTSIGGRSFEICIG